MSLLRGLFIAVLLLQSVGATPSRAQSRNRGPIILELAASTRALALGNAFFLEPGDADAVFYHPGLVGRAQGMGASIRRFSTPGTLSTLSAGRSWFGGGVALGIQHLGYEVPADGVETIEDILNLSGDEASLREVGDAGASELVLSVGYGKTLFGAQVGAVGKFIEQRLGHRRASTAAVDLGVTTTQGPVTVGASVQNLGPSMTLAGGEVPLPTRFTLGASSRPTPVGPLDLALSSSLSYRLEGDVVPALGLEVGYWPVTGRTFVGRIGYRYLSNDFSAVPFTFGGAFLGDDIALEYAFQAYDSGHPSHSFSIGWR